MNIAHVECLAGQTNLLLVPAQPGCVIRILRLLVTAAVTVRVQLVNNPGPDATALLSPFVVSSAGLNLVLGRGAAIGVRPGEACGVSTTPDGGTGQHTITVWYEVA